MDPYDGRVPFQTKEGHDSLVIYSVAVETGETLVLGRAEPAVTGDYVASAIGVRSYDVAPDATRFVVMKPVGGNAVTEEALSPKVILVRNWFEELKRLVPISSP